MMTKISNLFVVLILFGLTPAYAVPPKGKRSFSKSKKNEKKTTTLSKVVYGGLILIIVLGGAIYFDIGKINRYLKWLDRHPPTFQEPSQLHRGATLGVVDNLYQALKRDSSIINSTDKSGNTALQLACMHHRYDAVEFLLAQKDINVNLGNNKQGYTPITTAAFRGYFDIVLLILNAKDLNQPLEINVKRYNPDIKQDETVLDCMYRHLVDSSLPYPKREKGNNIWSLLVKKHARLNTYKEAYKQNYHPSSDDIVADKPPFPMPESSKA